MFKSSWRQGIRTGVFSNFGSRLKNARDIAASRFNMYLMAEKINWDKLARYASLYQSATLDKRIRLLKKHQQHVTLK